MANSPYGSPQGEFFFAALDKDETDGHWRYIITQAHTYDTGDTEYRDYCLVVNITSIKDGVFYDNACLLNNSHFDFLDKDSFVYYQKAKLLTFSNVRILLNNYGRHTKYSNLFNPAVHNLIVNGLRNSDFTDPLHLEFLESSLTVKKRAKL